jgi:hypothetical protein
MSSQPNPSRSTTAICEAVIGMSSGYSPPPATPLGLGGIMRTALAMYRAAPLSFVVVALVSTLPYELLLAGSQIAYGTPATSIRVLLRDAISLVPQLLLGQLSVAATAVIVMQMLNGKSAHAGSALELVGERFWQLAAVVVVTSVGIVLGFFALLIPGLYLVVVWLFAPIVSVTEDRALRSSMERSAGLAKGAFWWILGSYLAIQITIALSALLITELISIPLNPIGGTIGTVIRGVGAFVALTVVAPVANAGVALLYIDRRVREDNAWPGTIGVKSTRNP